MPSGSVYDAPATVEPRVGEHDDMRAAAPAIVRPAGPAAAVVLAAGVASFTLGLLSVLTAASGAVSEALTVSNRVGDISGLTTAAGIVFFGAWAGLTIAWRHADPSLRRVAVAAAALIVLGLLGTFPPVFNLVGG